jgi:hypothetical protein
MTGSARPSRCRENAGNPKPLVMYGGDLVTPADPDALTTVILALRQFQTSVPRLRAWRDVELDAAEEALTRVRERMAGQRAVPLAAQAPAVAGLAKQPGSSEVEEITTAEAARLYGMLPESWRQLAAAGRIRSRKADRNVRLLHHGDVIAYAERRRRGRGDGSGKAPEGEDGTGRACGGAAAA